MGTTTTATTATTAFTGAAAPGPRAACPPCALGLAHCHAIAIEHADGVVECLEGCGGGLVVHDDAVACGEAGLGCCPVEPGAEPWEEARVALAAAA